MSWDAELLDEATGETIYETNYTHNTNRMLHVAYGGDFFAALHGAPASKAAQVLDLTLRRLPEGTEPDPENGWGSRGQLTEILEEMLRVSLRGQPAHWRVSL